MSKFTNPLNNIRIASPCQADWNQMIGNERQRFCGACQLNVYNLSGMPKTEAENLLVSSEGRLCVRFYKRVDGTVLTKDCPVGWQAIKRRVSKVSTAIASLVFGMISALGLNAYFDQPEKENVMGAMVYVPSTVTEEPVGNLSETSTVTPVRKDKIQAAWVGRVVMGAPTVGDIGSINEVRQQVKKKRRR